MLPALPAYAELHCLSNFSFLRGASHAEELVARAKDLGYHAYMMPRDAAEGLTRLKFLPKHNEDLPWDDYPELDKMELFK